MIGNSFASIWNCPNENRLAHHHRRSVACSHELAPLHDFQVRRKMRRKRNSFCAHCGKPAECHVARGTPICDQCVAGFFDETPKENPAPTKDPRTLSWSMAHTPAKRDAAETQSPSRRESEKPYPSDGPTRTTPISHVVENDGAAGEHKSAGGFAVDSDGDLQLLRSVPPR